MASSAHPSGGKHASCIEDLAFHFAVWDDDIDCLQRLLLLRSAKDTESGSSSSSSSSSSSAPSSLEILDLHGNTPLLLAYRMGRTKAARMLLAAGAHSKARSTEGFEAVQVAGLTGNTDLIRAAVIAYLEETDAAFARRLPALQATLASMPDFTLRMSWEFSSWVPLLGRLLPSDLYSIHKRGSSLRLDTTLLGMNGWKWERGSVSLLLWGADMPRPGAMFVLDNEMKTAADARLSFTHPQDVHIQDWVRKLLTQKQKATDYWARDASISPVLKEGLIGGLFGKVKALALGDDTPRGRLSEGSTPVRTSSTSSSGGNSSSSGGDTNGNGNDNNNDGSGDQDLNEEDGGGAFGSGAAIAACTDPRQVKEDAGVWSGCSVYELKNLCVRDITHPPIMQELKLSDWWKPEYSRQATEEEAAQAISAVTGNAGGAGAATTSGGGKHGKRGKNAKKEKDKNGKHTASTTASTVVGAGAGSAPTSSSSSSSSSGGGGGAGAVVVGDVATAEAPEQLLKPLHTLLRAIRLGKINESNAASATMEQLEGLASDDSNEWGNNIGSGSGISGGGGGAQKLSTAKAFHFEEYFGYERPSASLDHFTTGSTPKATTSSSLNSSNTASAKESGESTGSSHPYLHSDGKLHKPTGRVCSYNNNGGGTVSSSSAAATATNADSSATNSRLTIDDKSLDVRILFAKDFPITTQQFLPIAEIMARTSRHASNIRRFFATKMPVGAGFPVQFTLPVFPTVTAKITFEFCDTHRTPPKDLFMVPADFKLGAYVERGFIRQL